MAKQKKTKAKPVAKKPAKATKAKPAAKAAKPAKAAANKPKAKAAKPATKAAAKTAKPASPKAVKPTKAAAAKPATAVAAAKPAKATAPAAAKPAKTTANPGAKTAKAAKPGTTTAETGSADAASSDGLLRGIALVDASLAERAKRGPLTGMSADQIAAIDLGGKPLSPSLARWLASDSKMFTLGPVQTLTELLETEVDVWAPAFADLTQYLQGPVVLFEGWGADSRRFLYLGATDEYGEYPVFTIDTDDTPFACINGPVDVWLAQQAGALANESVYGEVPPAYEPARMALAKKCFGGNITFVDMQFSKRLDPYS